MKDLVLLIKETQQAPELIGEARHGVHKTHHVKKTKTCQIQGHPVPRDKATRNRLEVNPRTSTTTDTDHTQ